MTMSEAAENREWAAKKSGLGPDVEEASPGAPPKPYKPKKAPLCGLPEGQVKAYTDRMAQDTKFMRDSLDPAYYQGSQGPQPIDLIRSMKLDFFEGCVVKYVCRWRKKGGLEDLYKARVYLGWLIENAEFSVESGSEATA